MKKTISKSLDLKISGSVWILAALSVVYISYKGSSLDLFSAFAFLILAFPGIVIIFRGIKLRGELDHNRKILWNAVFQYIASFILFFVGLFFLNLLLVFIGIGLGSAGILMF